MQPAEAARYIRQVATIGLPPSASIPLMMQALEHVVRSQNNPFSWTQPDGMPTHVWLPEIAPHAFEAAFAETFADRGPDAPTIDKLTGGPRAFNNTADVYRLPRWQSCALKNELLRYYEAEQSCDFAVRDRGVLKASFSVSRSQRSAPFTSRELRRVLMLVPYFLHALNAPCQTAPDDANVPAGAAAQLTAATDGTVLACGPKAEEYLFKISDVAWPERRDVSDIVGRLAPAVVRMIAQLDPLSNAPPTTDITCRWGSFRVMAHPLKAIAEIVPDMVLITIQPLVPATAHYLARLARYSLSPTERKVAMLMTEIGGADVLAAQAGLTLDSYRQVAKRIYSALEVSGRDRVRALLRP